MARFRAEDLVVESKPDLTPVTDADRTAEEHIRAQLKRTRPRDAVEGEEFDTTGHGPRRWVIDPIDGTKNFVRGVPVWATLIALVDDGMPVVGLVSAPALGRRWWAATGSGAYTGRSLSSAKPIRVSKVAALEDASHVVRLDRLVAEGRPLRRVPRPRRDLLAVPRLRRLLVLHARRRGGRRHRDRARPRGLRHGRPGARSSPRPAAGSPRSTAATAAGAATRVATNGLLHDEVLGRIGTGVAPPAGRRVHPHG